MSTITQNVRLTHRESGISFTINSSRTSVDPGIALENITVGTTNEQVDVSEYDNPRHILLRLMSGDDLLVGLNGSTYPFRLSGADDFMVLRLDIEGIVETQTVQTVADVSDNLDSTYFVVTDVNGETWGVGFGAGPFGSVDNEVQVTIATNDTAATVAEAIYDALVANAEFSALFTAAYDSAVDNDFLTITDKSVGTRANIADTGSTGFTIATPQQGAGSQAIHIKSVGSSQIVAGVIPD